MDKNTRFNLVMIVIFILIYLAFYPVKISAHDEADYIRLSYLIKEGRVFPDKSDIRYLDGGTIPVPLFIEMKKHNVPVRALGLPVLLVPFILFGWPKAFLLPLAFHITGFIFFVKILERFSVKNWLGVLYLFFPAFVLYSRTVMVNLPSSAIFLASIYFYLKEERPSPVPGVLMGASFLIYSTNILLFLSFFAPAFIKDRKKALSIFLGAAPFLAIVGLYNYFALGSPFYFSYYERFTGVKIFSLSYFPRNLMLYALALAMLYPLMILSPFLSRKTRLLEFNSSILIMIVFYSLYYFHDAWPSGLQTILMGTRFLFPTISLFLIQYSEIAAGGLEKLPRLAEKIFRACATIVLICVTVFVASYHQHFLKNDRGYNTFLKGVFEKK